MKIPPPHSAFNLRHRLLLTTGILCVSAGTLFAKDVFVEGVSLQGGWFDVSKYAITGERDDSNMCGFATAANMLAYWQSRHPNAFPSSMPQGAKAIYDDMYRKYENISGDPFAILGVAENNLVKCYLDDYYGEVRDFAVRPLLNNPYGFTDPYYGRTNQVLELDGLMRYMSFPETVKWALDHNSPMAFTVLITDPLYGSGSHALTVWGAKYNDITGDILGIYYTNSDDRSEEDYGKPHEGMKYSGDGNLYSLNGTWTWKREDYRPWTIFDVTMLYPPALYTDAIPEPSAFGLLAGTLALALCAARRRRRKS